MDKKNIIIPIVLIMLMALCLLYAWPRVKSYENGGPIYPKGCESGGQFNVTYSGQVITTYPWSDKCCTKVFIGRTGRNNYEKECWDKL